MGLVYAPNSSKKLKVKKKAGWKKEAEEYAAWQEKHKANPKLLKELKESSRTLKLDLGKSPRIVKQQEAKSVMTPPKKQEIVHDPRVLYKDNEEMLERELAARERKFNAGPIYNKGNDVLITDEMMKDIRSGKTRRR
jgi:hypothetical protein